MQTLAVTNEMIRKDVLRIIVTNAIKYIINILLIGPVSQ